MSTEPAVEPVMTPGEMIAAMDNIREERKSLAQRDKELVQLWRDIESAMIAHGDNQGMNKMSSEVDGATLTATITEEVVPNAVDWDEIYKYIIENEAMHILQRRVSTAAFRELQGAGESIPGVEPYTNRKILLRKTKR